MKIALPPSNEAEREAALRRYGILDTPPDAVLDGITQAVADMCEAPIALISLIDHTRVWFMSCIGMPVRETSRDIAFCTHAILDPGELMEVEDASLDDRFRDNPSVTGDPKIRFYAGKPLVTPDGFALGTLCVIDVKPRKLSPAQRDGLSRLAQTVTDLFHERRESAITAIDHIVEQAVLHGVLITDPNQPDNPITYVNQAFESMTGYSKAEVMGKNCRFLQGPDTNPDSVTDLRDAIAEHRSYTATLKNYRKDGGEFWNDLTVSPVRDSAGNTVSFVGVQQDVSDRYLAHERKTQLTTVSRERELARASRNRLAQLVEDSSNEIYVADADTYQIVNANSSARGNLGYSVEESENLMPWNFVVGVTRENIEELMAPLRAGILDAKVFETAHKRKDGTTYPVATHLQYMATQTPPVYAAICQDITERLRQEESVRLRERAIEAVDVGVTITDATQDDHPLVYVNQALCAMTGYTADELTGQSVRILQKNNPQQPEHLEIEAAQSKGEPVQVLLQSTRKDGSHYMDELSLSPVHNPAGELTHYIGINRDVTERIKTQAHLHRSQKLEAIGQLSGGIAHDFNNLLSVITGNLEFLAMDITDKRHRDLLNDADSAAQMGARLTRRLLTFAKQRKQEPTVLNVNEHVLGALELLRSTIGETITLSSHLAGDLWSIRVDPSEIENTVVNLAINARDAMPDGGKIMIETRNLCFSEGDVEVDSIVPGDYVQLSVSDTGRGMTDEVKARIFEPFFTTKETGTGTGLGLASIYGFAQQSGGSVRVHSQVDHGTVVNVYLPRNTEDLAKPSEAQPLQLKPANTEHCVLVVEDNEMVRKVTVKRLIVLGYNVVQASNGPEAVQLLENDARVDLVLTDLVMDGGMSGYDVARWVQTNLPQSKILLTSGFSEQMAEANDINVAFLHVLQKPYSLAELQQAVSGVLEETTADA